MNVKFEIAIRSGNDSFVDCPSFETARILRDVAESIERSSMYCEGNCADINGNTVGSFSFVVEDES